MEAGSFIPSHCRQVRKHTGSGIEGKAERNPMFVLEFVRELFKFTLNTPALDVLFQLPPQIGTRYNPLPKFIYYIGHVKTGMLSAAG